MVLPCTPPPGSVLQLPPPPSPPRTPRLGAQAPPLVRSRVLLLGFPLLEFSSFEGEGDQVVETRRDRDLIVLTFPVFLYLSPKG